MARSVCNVRPSEDIPSTDTIQFFMIRVSVRLSHRSLHRGEQKKLVKNCAQSGLNPGPLNHYANALPTEPSQHSVTSLNLHGLYKVMLYWFQKWIKFKMWSGAWNKAHFRNLLANTYQPSTASRALDWWSRGHRFNANWGQFLTNFFSCSVQRSVR